MTRHSARLIPLALLAGALLLAPGMPEARADFKPAADALAEELKNPAETVARHLQTRSVTMGVISTVGVKTSGGNLVKQAMVAALKGTGAKVIDEGGAYQIDGKARVIGDQDLGTVQASIEFELIDTADSGLPPVKIPFSSTSKSLIVVLQGITVTLPAGNAGKEEQQAALLNAIPPKDVPPGETTGGSEIRSGDYSIEILAGPFNPEAMKPSGPAQPVRTLVNNAGNSRIELAKNQYVEVRLRNYDKKFDTAVELLLDGVNMFAFSEFTKPGKDGKPVPQYSHMIVSRAKDQPTQADIPGWHKTNEESFQFTITDLPQSAATLLGKQNSHEVGTITAIFRQAWDKNEPPPLSGLSGEAFGKGPVIAKKYVEVSKNHGQIVTTITVRYRKPQD